MKTFLAGLILPFIVGVSTFGDTLTVTKHDDSGPGSLRDTIAAAVSGDTIVFDLPTPDTITLTTAGLLIDKDLTITGPGADELTVARSSATGTPAFIIFDITQGTFTMSGLTISNGDGGMSPFGGGMHTLFADTTVSGCHFTNNRGAMGGGFASEALGNNTLSFCTFTGNVATVSGGGVYVGGNTNLSHCTISDNTATYAGGGIAVYDFATVSYSTISFNSLPSEPASTTADGAGIYNVGYVTIRHSTITTNHNYRGNGGGISSPAPQLDVSDSTFYGNTAQGDGGAIWNGGPTTLTDCTVTNNTASEDSPYDSDLGGGGVANLADLGGSVTVKNTIIAANQSPIHPDVVTAGSFPQILSDGYNLVGDGTGGDITPATGDQIGTEAAPIDPMLEPLADNGGSTETCALLPGSPAIDVGDPNAPQRDQRNYDRSNAPDIGAFELGATIPETLGNISTRVVVGAGDEALIGGLIVSGTHPKPILLRGIGPSLALGGKLADPVLELHDSAGDVIASNDNWQSNSNQQEIVDTGLAPNDPLEAALLLTLDPGAYTAIVRGANGGTGIALVDAYDRDVTTDSVFGNISTRGLVQSGDNVMIGGFIILGSLDETVLVRAIGPSLSDLGVDGALEDPLVELHDSNGDVLMTNDNWRDTQEAEIEGTGLEPSDDAESAILSTLAPGGYTAIVRGVGNTGGVALVEVYRLN